MLNQPKFRDCFHVESLEAATFLISEKQFSLLQEPVYQVLVPLLQGQLGVDEIVDQALHQLLPATASQQEMILAGAQVYHALMLMERQGYIVEPTSVLSPELALFCDHLNLDAATVAARLANIKVSVKAWGSVPVSDFISTLESLKLQVAKDSDEAEITIILTDDYLRDELEAFNQVALKTNRAWMLIKPVGAVVWIGPIFVPGKTGCWECLAHRLRLNRPIEAFIQRHKQVVVSLAPKLAAIASTLETASNIAATEVLKWVIQGMNQRLEGTLVTLDTLSLQLQNHHLVQRPQCPCCGQPELNQQVLPLILGNRLKVFTADGGHRCVMPETTVQTYQHHISPITGVVRELRAIAPRSQHLIHAYVARHHSASMFDDLAALSRTLGGKSAGKGKTDQQAQASGLCEALERYSGVYQGDEVRIKSSFEALDEKAIHPNTCMNFSQDQYDSREAWNTTCQSFFQQVPHPFDPTREIEWTPLWSLTQQEFKYLPTAYCYFGYPKPAAPDCWADSNGCAAGNTLEEAILHGFLELVERDSVALWWYNRLQKPAVDVASFHEPYFLALQDYYRTLHRDLWVLDLTSDLQIPTFAAMSRRTDQAVEDVVLGYGTHFDARIALSRALTEVSQLLAAVLSSSPDGKTQYPAFADPLAVAWWQAATLENQPYLAPDRHAGVKTEADYPRTWSNNLLDDVLTCQKLVESKGMELLVLDQTRPDIGLKVVKVVVPGMRHFWKRLGPGRLYEVPVEMGWLPAALDEDQLNPFPMWM